MAPLESEVKTCCHTEGQVATIIQVGIIQVTHTLQTILERTHCTVFASKK